MNIPENTNPAVIDASHLARQREFSERTFGPGPRTAGVVDHIRKELREIEADPSDLSEWVDVVILALDGAWRAGHGPQDILDAIVAKQARNEARTWPDWRTAAPDKAIEHDRSKDGAAPPTIALERVRTDDDCCRVFEPHGVGTGFLTYDPNLGDAGTVTFDRMNRPAFDAEREALICQAVMERGGEDAVYERLEYLYRRLCSGATKQEAVTTRG